MYVIKEGCARAQVLGDNLLSLIKVFNYRGIPLPLVKHITKQVLEAMDYIHSKLDIIHTDLKPENVMLTEAIRPRKWLQPVNASANPVLASSQAPTSGMHRSLCGQSNMLFTLSAPLARWK